MTSRVSFPKLILTTLRRHMTAVLITALVFIILLISFFLSTQNIIGSTYITDGYSSSFYADPDGDNYEFIIDELTDLTKPNVIYAMITAFIGVFLAFDFFRYLHSKKETDFYESMPAKKQARFGALTIAGIGLFLVLCAITMAIEIAIIYSTGFGSKVLLTNMLWNFVCMVGAFLVAWATTVLAMMLTGHIIVAFLAAGVFTVYIPLIIGYLIPCYAGKFFETYRFSNLDSKYYYFSPVTLVYKATSSWRDWNISEHWTYLLGCFIFAIVIGIITYFLFLRRPAETAGRAMAFEKANFVIRFMLVIPLALYIGLFLGEVSSYASMAWHIFGIVFAAFLLHGIMESIFQFDIKALISKKKQLLLTIVLCLGFLLIFWFDIFKYDTFIPDVKEVKSITFDTYLFNPSSNEDTDEYSDGLTGEYIEMALTAIKDIQKGSDPDAFDQDSDYYMHNFYVTYHLNNGMSTERQYAYYAPTFPESLDKLYATKAMKDDYCLLYHLDKVKVISLGVSNGGEYFAMNLSDKELKEFAEIYTEEYTKLTLTQSQTENAVFELVIVTPRKNSDRTNSNRYPVYTSFTKTLEYLRVKNMKTFQESDNIKLQNLEIYGATIGDHVIKKQYIENVDVLNVLKEYMIIGGFMYKEFYSNDEYVYCDLRYETNGNTEYTSVYIPFEKLLEVLKK